MKNPFRIGRPLSQDEQRAVAWARANHPRWRKRFGDTREEHRARKPAGILDDVWDAWFDSPFGIAEWNGYVKLVRGLFEEERRYLAGRAIRADWNWERRIR